jgi:hypothetical protein
MQNEQVYQEIQYLKDKAKISDFGGISKEKVCDKDKSRVTVPVDRVYDE